MPTSRELTELPTKIELPPELQEHVSQFKRWIKEREQPFHAPVQQTLFHYTDAAGLAGIIESDSLWFNDTRFLNDPSEGHFARNFAVLELRRVIEGSENPLIALFASQMLTGLGKFAQRVQYFAGCFSLDGDKLDQWRAYADNGRGFCLGLTSEIFSQVGLAGDVLDPFSVNVRYDESTVVEEQRRAIEKTIELLRLPNVQIALDESPGLWKEFFARLSVELAKWIEFLAMTFKHPGYSEEREVRLLFVNATNKLTPYLRTRVRGQVLVPYLPWKFQPSLRNPGILTEVRVGPSTPPDSESSTRVLLRSHGIDVENVCITRSSIPYRALR